MAGQTSGISEEINDMVIKGSSQLQVHPGLNEREENVPRRLCQRWTNWKVPRSMRLII